MAPFKHNNKKGALHGRFHTIGEQRRICPPPPPPPPQKLNEIMRYVMYIWLLLSSDKSKINMLTYFTNSTTKIKKIDIPKYPYFVLPRFTWTGDKEIPWTQSTRSHQYYSLKEYWHNRYTTIFDLSNSQIRHVPSVADTFYRCRGHGLAIDCCPPIRSVYGYRHHYWLGFRQPGHLIARHGSEITRDRNGKQRLRVYVAVHGSWSRDWWAACRYGWHFHSPRTPSPLFNRLQNVLPQMHHSL